MAAGVQYLYGSCLALAPRKREGEGCSSQPLPAPALLYPLTFLWSTLLTKHWADPTDMDTKASSLPAPD